MKTCLLHIKRRTMSAMGRASKTVRAESVGGCRVLGYRGLWRAAVLILNGDDHRRRLPRDGRA